MAKTIVSGGPRALPRLSHLDGTCPAVDTSEPVAGPGSGWPPHGSKAHDRSIRKSALMNGGGTDITTTVTLCEGRPTVFVAVGHATAEMRWDPCRQKWQPFRVLEPIRQDIREHFGRYAAGIASGLSLRHDYGSADLSDPFQNELRFLGIEKLPIPPAGRDNHCAERPIRTLKETPASVHSFDTIEPRRQAPVAFEDLYNPPLAHPPTWRPFARSGPASPLGDGRMSTTSHLSKNPGAPQTCMAENLAVDPIFEPRMSER
jgi:hypothetical protein